MNDLAQQPATHDFNFLPYSRTFSAHVYEEIER